MILKGAPILRFQRLVMMVVVVVVVEAKECSEVSLIVQSPHDTCPPCSHTQPWLQLQTLPTSTELKARESNHISVSHGLPAPKPERCRLHRANAVVYVILDWLTL